LIAMANCASRFRSRSRRALTTSRRPSRLFSAGRPTFG
jgi:hypothetical protein